MNYIRRKRGKIIQIIFRKFSRSARSEYLVRKAIENISIPLKSTKIPQWVSRDFALLVVVAFMYKAH